MKDKIIKVIAVLIPILIVIFIIIWANKSREPVNDATTERIETLKATNVWWNKETDATSIVDMSIPDNYIKVPGTSNLYMITDSDDKVTDYVIRTINEDGSSGWEIYNSNISSLLSHVEGNVYKYVKDNVTYYFEYSENTDGTYNLDYLENYEEDTSNTVKTESVRETKYEDGFVVVYETVIYKTYNAAGELINTRTEGPNVISRSKETGVDSAKLEWLNGIYNEYCTGMEYMDEAAKVLTGLINSNRTAAGQTEFITDDNSVEILIGKIAAAELIKNGFDYNSECFTMLEKYYPNYNIITLTLPASVGEDEDTIAKLVNDEFMKNESATAIRCGSIYSKCGVAIAKVDSGYVAVEIYNK